jgi:DNA (cytosine-5)-methyltransferase 1
MLTQQHPLMLDEDLVIDLFAGGGGASTGIEAAIGRPVDIAVNHNPEAIAMHEANHPQTRHFCESVWDVCPRTVTQGRPVALLHASPDCTHFSQAKGGQPRDRAIRSLSWVVHRWAGAVKPKVITLENVEQILSWSPLVAKRCPDTGRVMKTCGGIAEPGERVPVDQQYLVPCKRRKGRNWGHFVDGLRRMGYVVQWRKIIAADFGAPTTRERLFMVARCDGLPIVWPEPTHHRKPARGQRKWPAAASVMDWSIPCPSIFTRPKPLAEATLKRIARGVQKFVVESVDPFIVPASAAAPIVITMGHGEGSGPTKRAGTGTRPITDPINTITASGGGVGVACAYLMQANGGFNATVGRDMRDPVSTVTNTGSQQQLVTAHLATLRHHSTGTAADAPLSTIAAGGEHHALVQTTLAPADEASALRVAAFLVTYYGAGQPVDLRDPMDTITTRDRLALVTVTVRGVPHVIVDIGLRMLSPRELYGAQGFPPNYIIDRMADGTPLTKKAQVRMVGNSVSPMPMRAIVAANYPFQAQQAITRKTA